MPGRVHERRDGERGDAGTQDPFGKLLGSGDVVSERQRVTATHGREEDVVVAPEHALGHAGRAARVDAVEVVGAARREPPGGGRRCQCRLVVLARGRRDRCRRRPPARPVISGMAHRAPLAATGESAVEDETHQCGVPVEVLQLARRIAIVDVDGHGTDLEARQHALDVLGAVGQLQADPITGTDADALEVVGEAVGPLVQLGVGEPSSAGHHRRLASPPGRPRSRRDRQD